MTLNKLVIVNSVHYYSINFIIITNPLIATNIIVIY